MAETITPVKPPLDWSGGKEVDTDRVGDFNSDQLDGLRKLLADWKQVSSTDTDQARNRRLRESAKASIYSSYLSSSTREDEELVAKWTDTLNILLTFAGLLSSTITGFLLSASPAIHPDPLETTNKILVNILQQLDKNVAIPSTDDSYVARATRISGLWHASLACSILFAFGALLSKQWLIHYESYPAWANTIEKRCRLRELRLQGFAMWRLYTIMETLPIILQISVFLFVMGIAQYLDDSPTLFMIVMSFITLGGFFFIFTLIAGIIYPSCPFKSPLTDFIMKLVRLARYWSVNLTTVAVKVCKSTAPILDRCTREMRDHLTLLRSGWKSTMVQIREQGEMLLVGEGTCGDVGILLWSLHREDTLPRREQHLEAAAETFTSLPPKLVDEVFRYIAFTGVWCSKAVRQLDLLQPTSLILLETDILCFCMYNSPLATHVAFSTLGTLPGNKDENVMSRFSRILRQNWSYHSSTTGMPIYRMRKTTIALYIRTQLQSWIEAPESRGWPPNTLLLKEMAFILHGGYLAGRNEDLVNVITLMTLVLLEIAMPGVDNCKQMNRTSPWDQLLDTLQRLSSHPHNTSSDTASLVPLLVRSSTQLISGQLPHLHAQHPLWRAPETCVDLADMFCRFFGLGTAWASSEELGAHGRSLLREFYAFVMTIIRLNESISHSSLLSTSSAILPPHKLPMVLAAYACTTSESGKLDLDGLRVLDFALGLRCHSPPPSFPSVRLLLQTISTRASAHQRGDPDIHDEKDDIYIHTIRQLIRDLASTNPKTFKHHLLETVRTPAPHVEDCKRKAGHIVAHHIHRNVGRRLLLSVITKGKDIFIPPLVSAQHPGTSEQLDLLSGHLVRSGEYLKPLDKSFVDGFENWDDLMSTLRDAEQYYTSKYTSSTN